MLFLNLLCFFNLFSSKKDKKKSEPISVVEITQELGISPVLSEKYRQNINSEANTFSCFDGLKVINLSLFNNNYCDCQDCSDEPGSPASATEATMTKDTTDQNGNELLSYFYCQNPGYVPALIPRWEVGDGLCSCCDGADEAFNPHARCTNKCKKLEKKRAKLVSAVDQAYRKGNEKYKTLIKEGYTHQENAEKVYALYQPQIDRLEKAKTDIDNAREIQTPTPSPDPEASIGENLEENIEENLDEETESDYDYYNEVHHREEEEQVFSERVDDDQIENNAVQTEIQEENQNENEESQKENEENQNGNDENHNEEEASSEKDNHILEEYEKLLQQIEYENNGTNCSQTNDKDFFYSYHFPFCIDDSENPYPNGLTYDMKNDRRNAVYNKIDELKNKMNSEESTIKYYNKNIPPEFLTLAGKEFSKNDFKFTFLEEIKESYSSLGKFKEYKDGEFLFEDGAYCWETSCGKKTRMRFICWEDDALVSVTEAMKCEYKAVFATPLVCTDDYAEKATNMTVEQLKYVREEAGI